MDTKLTLNRALFTREIAMCLATLGVVKRMQAPYPDAGYGAQVRSLRRESTSHRVGRPPRPGGTVLALGVEGAVVSFAGRHCRTPPKICGYACFDPSGTLVWESRRTRRAVHIDIQYESTSATCRSADYSAVSRWGCRIARKTIDR